jgi:hypothetical protein
MRKEYYKLKDFNEDIRHYEAKLRSLCEGSSEYQDVLNFLNGLRVKKNAAIRKNAGNPEFFHNGIPPLKKQSMKQQKLSAIDRAIKEMRLRHEKELSALYRERKEVKDT